MTALQEAPVRSRRGPKSAIHDSHAPLIRRLYWEDGRTIAYIAGLYGFSPAGMRKWMAVHGIPRRPRTGHAGGVASIRHLRAYNAERTQQAAPAQIARVRAALDKLGSRAHPVDAEAGRLRIAYPGDSLTALGARAGVTKDVIAGRLRRLLLAAGFPECSRPDCGKPVLVPVSDPEDPLGRHWCSEECRDADAEGWSEQHYGYGVAT